MVYCAATGSQYQVYMKLCLLRNTQKRDKTKRSRGKTDIENLSILLEKVFAMDFLQKMFLWCF
jgi:hypothetical protein